MAKFLFTVWPFRGHVHPNVAIAHALCERGHEAAFYTGASVRASLEAEGLRGFPFRHVEEARIEAIVLALDALSLQWWRARHRKALLREWLLETVEAQLEDLAGVLPVWRPDVIVCDPAMWGPLLVLQETTRIPLAIMSYVAACMLPGPDGPILGLPLPRANGQFAQLGRRVLRSVVNVAAADVRRAANQLRARCGLSPLRTTVTAFSGQMPLYLVPSTPAFDRERHDLPPSVQYVGPCQWDKPSSDPPAPWLTNMPRGRAVVYVTEGTLHSKAPLLLAAALRGLSSLPVQVIATTGKHRDPTELGLAPIPCNARVERWVPHSDLLPRTDVVVTTGGTGTVLGSLSAGVPLVVAPTAWDQPENAWRVAEAGAGVRLTPRQCTPKQVRNAVQRVLNDQSFRLNARRLATDFARYGGAAQAADLLEDLAIRQGDPLHREDTEVAPAFFGGKVRPSANDTIHAFKQARN
jgi:MGT family glycosyltransferase